MQGEQAKDMADRLAGGRCRVPAGITVTAGMALALALTLPASAAFAEADASAGNAALARMDAGGAAEADAPRPARKRTPRPVAVAAPEAVAIPVAAPDSAGTLAVVGGALVAGVTMLGFAALFGAAPTPGVATAAVAVLTLLALLAVIVALRVGNRSRRRRPLGPPVAQPLRDLGPITIGLLGREGEAGPITALLVPVSKAGRGGPDAPATSACQDALETEVALADRAAPPGRPATARAAPRAPAGFDAAGFVTAARNHFLRLQQAWDDGDTAGMEAMMTTGMISRVHGELERRQSERRRAEHTEILMLDAELLGVKTVGQQWTASVRFRGRMRDLDATVAADAPDAFDEIWNFDRASPGEDRWLLAGIEPLHARPESA